MVIDTVIIDFTKGHYPLFAHQKIGIEKILTHPYFFLADQMGAGKSLQAIYSAQTLFVDNQIDRVIVIAPAPVRSVWFDQELGELAKHLWDDLPAEIIEYHARVRRWFHGGAQAKDPRRVLKIIITNFDFVRKADRLAVLFRVCNPRTLLILDESSAIKNSRAQQTKACMKLRERCGRVLLLNGTPIANSPADLYSQGQIMSPSILGCRTFFHFRARYGVMGGFLNKQVVKWINLDDLQQRFAPYVIRRLKTDCLDLPPKLPSVMLTATLTRETWALYKEMRDDLVAWIDAQTVSAAPQAVVKILRLSQLTSGFLGGVSEAVPDEPVLPLDLPELTDSATDTRETGTEKLDVFLEWLEARLDDDPTLKLLVWARFRPEVARLLDRLRRYPVEIGAIWGGQSASERSDALRLLDPRTAPRGAAVVVGTPQSGSMGLNLAAANMVVYLSNDYSLKVRLQSEDRVHRPGQTRAVNYFDVVAVGPDGQKTIDHTIQKALRMKENLATWTTEAWRRGLIDE